MKYETVTLGKADPDDIWIRNQLIRIEPNIKDYDTEYLVARAMRKLVLELRGNLQQEKPFKEKVLELCEKPHTVRDIFTKLNSSKSHTRDVVNSLHEQGLLHDVSNSGVSVWCTKKTEKKSLTKWQPVKPW